MQLDCVRWPGRHSWVWAYFPAKLFIFKTKDLNQQEPTRTHLRELFVVVKITLQSSRFLFAFGQTCYLVSSSSRTERMFTPVSYRHWRINISLHNTLAWLCRLRWKQRHKSCEHRSCLLLAQFGCMSPAGGLSPFHSWLQSHVSVSAVVWLTIQSTVPVFVHTVKMWKEWSHYFVSWRMLTPSFQQPFYVQFG